MSSSLWPHGPQTARLLCPWGILQARILEWVATSFSRNTEQWYNGVGSGRRWYFCLDDFLPQWSEFCRHSQVKDSRFRGSLSRCPTCPSLETRATQPPGPGQLTGAFVCFAFNYLSVWDISKLIYIQMCLHLLHLIFLLFTVITKRMSKCFYYDPNIL